MESLQCSNEEAANIFKRFLESKRLIIVPIGSCQRTKSKECDRLLETIDSLKQSHFDKEKKFGAQKQKFTTELLVAKQAHKRVCKIVIEKENQIKTLKKFLLKEKTEIEEKTQQIEELKKTLEDKNTNMEKKIAELQQLAIKDKKILEEKISNLTEFTKRLVEDIKFQTDEKTDLISTTELQRLLNYIREIIRRWENDRLGLQQVRKGFEAVVYANNSGSVLNCLQTPLEHPTSLPQSSSKISSETTIDLPVCHRPIKKKEHERDISFKYEGFRCTCGTIVKRESSLLLHIRKCTEPWKHDCSICKQKFFYESELKKHLINSPKCATKEKFSSTIRGGNTCSRSLSKSNPISSRNNFRNQSVTPNQSPQRNGPEEHKRRDFRSEYTNLQYLRTKPCSSWSNMQKHDKRYNDVISSQRPQSVDFREGSRGYHDIHRRHYSSNNISRRSHTTRQERLKSKESRHHGQKCSIITSEMSSNGNLDQCAT